MVKIIADVEGMACGMCEAHINDAVRNAFSVKKVTSSHIKGKTEIIADTEIEEEKLRETVACAGYQVLTVEIEPYERKKWFFLGRKL